MFSRFIGNQTYRFSYIFPLPYLVISEIDIKSSITDLVRTKFMLYRFSYFWFIVSMEISITVKKHIQPNFNFFPKTGVISTSTTVTEGCKTPTENTRYGPETTVSNHLQRNYCVSNQKATLDYQYY